MSLFLKQTHHGEQLHLAKDFILRDILVGLLLENIPRALVISKLINWSPQGQMTNGEQVFGFEDHGRQLRRADSRPSQHYRR